MITTFVQMMVEMVVRLPALDIPNPPPAIPPGLEKPASTVISWMKGIVIVGGVIVGLGSAGMIVVGRRNRNQMATEGVMGFAWIIGGLAAAAATVGIVTMFTP